MRETSDHVRALRAAEARYRSAIEMAPDAVFVADLEGHYVEVNSAACQMLGYSREQLLGKTIADLLPVDDLPRLAAARARLLTPGVVECGLFIGVADVMVIGWPDRVEIRQRPASTTSN